MPLAVNNIKVQINDELVHFPDAQPFVNANNRLMVPIRIITDKLGYSLDWKKTSNNQFQVTVTNKDKSISITTGETTATVNGSKADLDSPALFQEGRVFVPFRFVSESLGIRVQWDPNNLIAIMNEDGKYHAPAWYAPRYEKVIDAKATAYTGAASENGGRPGVDYFGNPLQIGTISVDPSVIPLGSYVYIEGYKYPGLPEGGMFAKATDTGGSIKGNKIDIFVPGTSREASKFGIQNVKIYVLKQ
jgi:3D (Asp-Asp-Asp) domain-containing protein